MMKTIKLINIFFFLTLSLFVSAKDASMHLKISSHNLAMKTDINLFHTMQDSLKERAMLPEILLVQEVVGETGEHLKEAFQMDGHFIERPWDKEAIGILSSFPILFKDGLIIKARAENGFTRTAIMVEVKHPKIGIIRVVCVHLAYRLEHFYIREKQIEEVRNWMDQRETNKKADLIVIGGDFNALINERGFIHLKDFYNPNSNIISHLPTARRIDYIFLKGKLTSKIKNKEIFPFPAGLVNGQFLSDHKTLLFDFKIKD